ncbi:hypothetical protein [Clostridium neonatale]|nr:hypothetical protein [Clostridium neonatale]MDU4477858.1 hypothetical protein [Clostridium sp.]CAG9712501.1 hypothetical protein CNEO_470026 [Clostridium neonatale]CAI3549275.1 hypothetical protein CNEO3_20127 [Clostridium neonatale]CAI3592095.1 hypothetical protein CNEO4_240016 [Clostridium neonatale]CAI3656321.1 hypothetical protein CNEO3_500007 [Clostridium neonatale]
MFKTTTAESLFMYDDEFYNELSVVTLNSFLKRLKSLMELLLRHMKVR